MGGFLSTATRFVDVRVRGDCKYVPPVINCNIENLTHKRAFGIDDLSLDKEMFKPHPKMYSRVFASIAGKVKGGMPLCVIELKNPADANATTTTTTTTSS